MEKDNKWKLDVAVLCIFFARPEQFRLCFEQVRKARPRQLLLWQDGPRKGRTDDENNIKECRDIIDSSIDWECEIHKNYHDNNMGCDPSTFNAHQWAFSIVDKCIILEDDLIASQSFFLFCKEMLDKYENDERIDRICGFNVLGIHEDTPYDYFYSTHGSSWGWASWRRVADTWNREYEFLDDEYTTKLLAEKNTDKEKQKSWIAKCQMHKKGSIPYWEEIIGARTLLYNGLVIFPKFNMISNVGIDANSTHAPKDINMLPESVQKMFNTKIYEMKFPCVAPPYILSDTIYEEKSSRLLNLKFTERLKRKSVSVIRKIKTGTLIESVKRKMF